MQRDNFTKATVSTLAKRVGYICSNPSCKRHTSGPHEQSDKSTIIGIASHVTAASPLGPRYDSTLSQEERISIDNGIWLCGNCSILIDKDEKRYTVDLLRDWKRDAEESMLKEIQGYQKPLSKKPFLEVDLFWNGSMRSPRGYSDKNPTEIDENGQLVTIIGAGRKPIIYWELTWKLGLEIHNNSSHPAYNIKIESIGDVHFTKLSQLRPINNLPPFKSFEIKASYQQYIESIHTVADEILSYKIPQNLEGLKLQITYLDEDRNPHISFVKILDNRVINSLD